MITRQLSPPMNAFNRRKVGLGHALCGVRVWSHARFVYGHSADAWLCWAAHEFGFSTHENKLMRCKVVSELITRWQHLFQWYSVLSPNHAVLRDSLPANLCGIIVFIKNYYWTKSDEFHFSANTFKRFCLYFSIFIVVIDFVYLSDVANVGQTIVFVGGL